MLAAVATATRCTPVGKKSRYDSTCAHKGRTHAKLSVCQHASFLVCQRTVVHVRWWCALQLAGRRSAAGSARDHATASPRPASTREQAHEHKGTDHALSVPARA